MKVKKFKSFRFKMVLYMFLSVLATFLTEALIFAGIYFYETEILAGEYRQVWGASGQGRLAVDMLTISESASLDILVILIFTMLLLIMYFILISHNFVTYVREIISGVEKMKSGDFQEQIPILKKTKRSEKEVDISPMILAIREQDSRIFMRLVTGSADNLKPSLVMEAFCRYLGYDYDPFAFQYHRLETYLKKGVKSMAESERQEYDLKKVGRAVGLFMFYCSVMPLLILDFNAGLFVIYIIVFLLVLVWLLWYINVRCRKTRC